MLAFDIYIGNILLAQVIFDFRYGNRGEVFGLNIQKSKASRRTMAGVKLIMFKFIV